MDVKKQEGFAGQVSVVLPDAIRTLLKTNQLTANLHLSDIGYYPKAKYHYKERPLGIEEDILIYVVDGKGQVTIENELYNMTSNQYIIIPSGSSHQYKANVNNPWSIYWVHFGGIGKQLFKNFYSKRITIEPSNLSRIKDRISLFNEIIEILSLGFSPDNLAYSNLCFSHLLASFRYVEQFRKINYSVEKDIIKKATLFMKQNIEKPLNLDQIAIQFSISVSHFSRLFRERTQHSPMNYFIQLKIQYACQLLDYSHFRIHEVAQAIGYSDAYYFSRIFKKVMGISPSMYKRRGISEK